ncbi:helix-turn-helix transcriptional regulator [Sedimenticola thiotaurini]|uniref:HTH araC/xylS-type domain-containing protein n=1 Tax=Sedimenticola thiotaurini TaxID=1543721 RepID=A0A0F7JZ84_9GAMM|nr:AraC family transcriptional regulator [Sedimenticola thiotaurini]AKH20584.1 hypothetical protein AAY24_09700 [Sedimenticola thiotaurini]
MRELHPLRNRDPAHPIDHGTSVIDYIEGRCSFSNLGLDLSIHTNDSLERLTGHQQFSIPPKITVALMLEGDLEATINGHPVYMTSHDGPSGYLWINSREARLDRWTRAGQRIRKINISLPFAQLLQFVDLSETCLVNLSDEALADVQLLRWKPNAQSLRFAEEIFASDLEHSAIGRLTGGMAALGLLRQALMQSEPDSPDTQGQTLNSRDAKRARMLRDFILEHIEETLSVETLARNSSMSPSTLQRLFKRAYGSTIMEFIRTRRLEQARQKLLEDGITVGEAAHCAGYSSTANFSTAFQRAFGYPPSACIGKSGK